MNYLKKYASLIGLTNPRETKDDYRKPPFARKPRLNRPLRVRILGDHTKLHCGCKAVINSLETAAKARGWEIVKSYRPYDILIVNGEGSMHSSRKTFFKKMLVLQKAVESGIPAYLLNTVWQNNCHDFDGTLARLAGITVREVLSQRELYEKHHIEADVVIDASYFSPMGKAKNVIDFKGKPVKTDFYFPETKSWGRDQDVFNNIPYISMENIDWCSLVFSLKTAAYLITGRHHAIYAACRAKTPFVASESNTHKINGLISSSGANIPIAKHPHEIVEIISSIDDLKPEYEKLFNWMEAQNAEDIIPKL